MQDRGIAERRACLDKGMVVLRNGDAQTWQSSVCAYVQSRVWQQVKQVPAGSAGSAGQGVYDAHAGELLITIGPAPGMHKHSAGMAMPYQHCKQYTAVCVRPPCLTFATGQEENAHGGPHTSCLCNKQGAYATISLGGSPNKQHYRAEGVGW